MADLKSCPFCGGKASVFCDESTDTWNVFCDNGLCPVEPATVICFSERGAIEAWNTRADVAFVTGTIVSTDAPEVRYVPERTCKVERMFTEPAVIGSIQEWECSECGGYTYEDAGLSLRYCSKCGAKVVGE